MNGIALPLFSLKSQKSCGIGEYLDLIPLLSWCKEVGFNILQLAPLNDTGPNFSPFSPISSCALDPIYISLHALKDPPLPLDDFASFNQLSHLDRSSVREKKIEWLCQYYSVHFPSISKTKTYDSFLKENPWLSDYATFKIEHEPQEFDFHLFLQYLSFTQMQEVKSFAEKLELQVKGDLPFLLPSLSADMQAYSSLFRTDLVAGAPPDHYNHEGQKWGFPVYDIEAMRSDHFHWWERRLKCFEKCYHLYRIDHVAGLFRTWVIPLEKEAKEGFFLPSDRDLWSSQGKEILSKFLSFSPLKPIAEDLGAHAQEVSAPVLKELNIPGTRVMRWERMENGEFIPYDLYEPLSMTTVSNFDLEPLPLWWQSSPLDAQAFARFKKWDYDLILTPDKHGEILRDSHHTNSLYHINPLQEYLLLFPELSHPTLQEERVNVPGTNLPSNWTYRFHPFIEQIIQHAPLRNKITELLYTQKS